MKRASVLFQGPNPADLTRFNNESPPLQQNQSENMRAAVNENKRLSMLQNPSDSHQQRIAQEKSASGSVHNQVSGTSTIEEQQIGSRVLQNDNSGVGNSNLIFNQADNRPMSRNVLRESLREPSEENRPNSRQKGLADAGDSGYSRPISRSQRPSQAEGGDSRPISRSQKGTVANELADEARPISGSQKHSVVESPDGTSIEDVQEPSIHQKMVDNIDSPTMMRSNYADDMGMYQGDPRNYQEMNERMDYNNPFEQDQYNDNYYNEQRGYPGSASSKHSFLMGPVKANVETQTVQENMLAILSNFDITKMEPYTLEFLRVLEGELSTMRFGIKEVKDGKYFIKL